MIPSTLLFQRELEAARFLLTECCDHLNRHGVNYVVVGGWSAYLFHSAKFGHPGTYDVDVLLHADSLDDGSFDRATETLLSSGYLRAPKNMFQAHRIIRVRDEDLVFHVDFLNERDPGNAIEMVGGTGKMKSIYTEAMKAVFKYGMFRTHVDFPSVRFPSPETFIVTKAAAALVMKRQRDAFDVFVTAREQDPAKFRQAWSNLCKRDGLFADADHALWRALRDGGAIEKIQKIVEELRDSGQTQEPVPTEQEILETFHFLSAASVHCAR